MGFFLFSILSCFAQAFEVNGPLRAEYLGGFMILRPLVVLPIAFVADNISAYSQRYCFANNLLIGITLRAFRGQG